jgi:hypothetical protein
MKSVDLFFFYSHALIFLRRKGMILIAESKIHLFDTTMLKLVVNSSIISQ